MSFPSLSRSRRMCSALLGNRFRRYTAREVSFLLGPNAPGSTERRRAVLATASVPSAWLDYLSQRDAVEVGRLAGRLPTIVFLYASGASLEEILGRVGGWGTWGVERALEAACGCIAACLNDGRLTTGPGVSEDFPTRRA
jgi:hypothetical protein